MWLSLAEIYAVWVTARSLGSSVPFFALVAFAVVAGVIAAIVAITIERRRHDAVEAHWAHDRHDRLLSARS
jgi:hypothetical protein